MPSQLGEHVAMRRQAPLIKTRGPPGVCLHGTAHVVEGVALQNLII